MSKYGSVFDNGTSALHVGPRWHITGPSVAHPSPVISLYVNMLTKLAGLPLGKNIVDKYGFPSYLELFKTENHPSFTLWLSG